MRDQTVYAIREGNVRTHWQTPPGGDKEHPVSVSVNFTEVSLQSAAGRNKVLRIAVTLMRQVAIAEARQ